MSESSQDPRQKIRELWQEFLDVNGMSWDEFATLLTDFRTEDLTGDIDPFTQFMEDRWGSIAEVTGISKEAWQDFWEPKRRLTILKSDLPKKGFPTVNEGALTAAVQKAVQVRPQKPFFPPDIQCIYEVISAIQSHGGNPTDFCAGLLYFSCEENRFEWKTINMFEFSVEFFKFALFDTEEPNETIGRRLLKPLQKAQGWTECSFAPTGILLKVFKRAYSQKSGAGRRGQFHHNMLMLTLSSWMEKSKIPESYYLIAKIMTSCFPEDFEPSFGPEHVRQTCNRTRTRKDQLQEIASFRRRLRDFKQMARK